MKGAANVGRKYKKGITVKIVDKELQKGNFGFLISQDVMILEN
jgi:hypothetical protein